MRAVLTDQQGGVRIEDIERQALDPDSVRIAVAAASINPIDAYVRDGVAVAQGWAGAGDLGLGWDVAGTVVEVGGAVSDPGLAPGRQVAALAAGAVKRIGGQAEEIVLPADAVAALPVGLDVVEAASVPLNALTAQQCIGHLGAPEGAEVGACPAV